MDKQKKVLLPQDFRSNKTFAYKLENYSSIFISSCFFNICIVYYQCIWRIYMVSSFTLQTDELDNNFLATIKKLFAGKEIEITIQDSQTDTDYLLKNPTNKSHLLASISSLEQNDKTHILSSEEIL